MLDANYFLTSIYRRGILTPVVNLLPKGVLIKKTSIAHKIEIQNNGDSVAMMAAIESMSSEAAEDQDWANEVSIYTFNDGSSLVFEGFDFERFDLPFAQRTQAPSDDVSRYANDKEESSND